ncbi:MAG: hypothetical protein WCS99_03840, partial [Limisphaerales bacterium]
LLELEQVPQHPRQAGSPLTLNLVVKPGQPLSQRRPQTGGVKNILSLWGHDNEAVASFGRATLHRRGDGRYELRGGSPADRADALEWASIFQHDAVFSQRPARSRSGLPAPSPRW